ncbi:MAG TPA: SCO family protein [Acidimicrobiia bacterium]
MPITGLASSASRRLLLGLVLASVALASCGGDVASTRLQGAVVEPATPKPSFVLTDTAGEPYDFVERTEGKLTLLYFGYLNCPDICPVHMAQIAEVFDQLPAVARDAVVVFVSVDPDRDSPGEIRTYLDNFDSRFVGLTGTMAELESAQTAAGIPLARYVGEGETYTVDHAGWVIAYAPDGLNHSVYPFGTRQSQWINDLQILAGMGG